MENPQAIFCIGLFCKCQLDFIFFKLKATLDLFWNIHVYQKLNPQMAIKPHLPRSKLHEKQFKYITEGSPIATLASMAL